MGKQMKKYLPVIVILTGAVLTAYFGFVLVIFATTDNPLAWPFISESIIWLMLLSILGFGIFIWGIILYKKMKAS